MFSLTRTLSRSFPCPALLPVVMALAFFLAFSGVCRAQAPDKPVSLKVQVLPIGTSWYIFGASYSKALQDVLPAGSIVDVVAKGGGVANIIAVEQGKADVALANLVSAVWAWNGDKEVFKGKQYRNVRALAGGLNSAWVTPCVRVEFLKKYNLQSLEEVLKSDVPVRMVMKPKGATVVTLVYKLLESMGLSEEMIKARGGAVIHVSPEQAESLMRDGQADIYFEAGMPNHPTITSISLTTDVVFPDLPETFVKAQEADGLHSTDLPRTFKVQTMPLHSFDMGTVLLVNKDMSDDLAYLLTKTLCEQRDAIASAHKAWEDFVPEKGWLPENTGVPLHPGAERYYRERGWMR